MFESKLTDVSPPLVWRNQIDLDHAGLHCHCQLGWGYIASVWRPEFYDQAGDVRFLHYKFLHNDE